MNKSVVITVVLAVGAIVASLSSNDGKVKKAKLVGTELFDLSKGADISEISITSSSGTSTVLIAASDKSWTIKGDSFPVEAQKIAAFLDKISDIKITRKMGDTPDIYPSLGLDAALQISVKAKDETLLDVKVGSKRKGGGVYASIGDNGASYLLNKDLSVFADESDWELKTLVNVPAIEIKEVEFFSDGGHKLVRESADKPFTLVGIKEGEEINSGVAGALANLLTNLNFSKRVTKENIDAASALEKPVNVKFTTYGGLVYDVNVGKVGEIGKEKWFVSVASVGGKEENAELKLLSLMNSKWSFEVSSYVGSKFEKKRSDFIKIPAKPKNG